MFEYLAAVTNYSIVVIDYSDKKAKLMLGGS
jgi:hypothetical protein